ncbi:MAG: LacI family DNA-binding transcriptional regulator [Bifidobacterium aquikefiri]|uniref:LacI family response repressor n=1 Tax=Bifidobacterium aquikefiri TaxID=1653207 RepID=A0A261G723_9BIFI|nr:LacI family DNA-binding transcriptional regulator [Bifidobacterium aquikefiri]OZG67209.1 LacI family response repressor [Bifidobacterium aquikefiri]
MVTAQDVADLAGVSRTTVSYVINGSNLISEPTKKQVMKAVKKLGYHPNLPARALAGGKMGFIGVAVRIDSSTNIVELYPHLSSIIAETESHNSNVILIPGQEGIEGIEKVTRQATIDGLLLFDIGLKDDRLSSIESMNLPCVMVGTTESTTTLPSVDVDYASIVRQQIDDLIRVGSQEIIFVDNKSSDANYYNFAKAFSIDGPRYCTSRGISSSTRYIENRHWQGIESVTSDIQTWKGRKVGIAIRTPAILDLMTASMRFNNLELGKDIPLVAVCADDFAQAQPTPITNIDPLADACSLTAVNILYSMLSGKEQPQLRTLLTPHLQRRKSTASKCYQ